MCYFSKSRPGLTGGLIISILIFVLSGRVADCAGEDLSAFETEVMKNISSMPLAFTENRGQWDDKYIFRASAGGASMWFTEGGAVYRFTRRISDVTVGPADHGTHFRDRESVSLESMVIEVSFVGAIRSSM